MTNKCTPTATILRQHTAERLHSFILKLTHFRTAAQHPLVAIKQPTPLQPRSKPVRNAAVALPQHTRHRASNHQHVLCSRKWSRPRRKTRRQYDLVPHAAGLVQDSSARQPLLILRRSLLCKPVADLARAHPSMCHRHIYNNIRTDMQPAHRQLPR